jgi:uncharacterized protein (TIGR02453 family)
MSVKEGRGLGAKKGSVASGFAGFGRDALQFFRELAENQNKTWFEENRTRYEAQIRDPARLLVAELSVELGKRGLPLHGDPRHAMFRLNRDVRFSADKSPYKTNAGVALTRTGNKMSPGVLYFHLDPMGCFAAVGFYRPDPEALQAIRARIVEKSAAWLAMEASLKKAGLRVEPDEDALKRLPRGFEAVGAPELHEALRARSFVIREKLTQKIVGTSELIPTLADFAYRASPLLNFGWDAMAGIAPAARFAPAGRRSR